MNKNDKDFLVQKIRTQYTEKENTELDALRDLDRKVKRPANVFSYEVRETEISVSKQKTQIRKPLYFSSSQGWRVQRFYIF